jgi:hypothetical protein
MLALHGSMGPFIAVENIIGKKLLGPFKNIDTAFSCSCGPIQSSRKQSLLGPYMNVDASYVCSVGPIQSGRKHFREDTSGPIREQRCHLSVLRWAHSKESEVFSGRKYWAHSGTSIPPFRASVAPYKLVGNILGKKLLGPFVNIDASYVCSVRPIQSGRKHFREDTSGPVREQRCHLSVLRWAHSK